MTQVVVLTPEQIQAIIDNAVETALERRDPMFEVMDTEMAAKFLKITPQALTKKAAKGEVPATKLGPEWRFIRSQLLEFLTPKEVA